MGGEAARSGVALGYVALGRDPWRRMPQLVVGLALYGFGLAAMVRASLGVSPWSVLYEGVQRHSPLSFGAVNALVGVAVLLLWIPLRQRPRFGTVLNILVLSSASDLGLALLPAHPGWAARVGLLLGGVLVNGVSIAIYVGARYGPGPRDGLMTGASAATHRSIRFIRTLMEVTVLVAGVALGGRPGPGTVLYAVSIGPIAQLLLPRLAYRTPEERGGAPVRSGRRSPRRAPVRPRPRAAAEPRQRRPPSCGAPSGPAAAESTSRPAP
ncbi:YczE/YyaS/YitT family protein [Actinacidiphila sp. bgisy145]|uniref:membrane protein YczE n=1 Tax=Actinacidiphila sp. bgisy145 TaxID=3413792 RepID=UPI003EB76AC2